jgi:hypothetical protein
MFKEYIQKREDEDEKKDLDLEQKELMQLQNANM